jgi:hypothetical protein
LPPRRCPSPQCVSRKPPPMPTIEHTSEVATGGDGATKPSVDRSAPCRGLGGREGLYSNSNVERWSHVRAGVESVNSKNLSLLRAFRKSGESCSRGYPKSGTCGNHIKARSLWELHSLKLCAVQLHGPCCKHARPHPHTPRERTAPEIPRYSPSLGSDGCRSIIASHLEGEAPKFTAAPRR